MSSAKRRRISVTGALPGRNPGIRATRARSRSTFWLALLTTSAGISSSISRLQVVSVMDFFAGEGPRNTLFPICLSPVRNSRGRTAGKGGQKQQHQKLQYKETASARQRRLGLK